MNADGSVNNTNVEQFSAQGVPNGEATLTPASGTTVPAALVDRISKRGNSYLRMLFVQAAASVVLLRPANWPKHSLGLWLEAAVKRMHDNVVAEATRQQAHRSPDGSKAAFVTLPPPDLNQVPQLTSKLDLFEAFLKSIIDKVQAKPSLFAHSAILVTCDETGGSYRLRKIALGSITDPTTECAGTASRRSRSLLS